MGVGVHDIVYVKRPDMIISEQIIPEWVFCAIKKTPYAIVRRIASPEGIVSIGIRGETRSDRFSAFILEQDITYWVKPEEVANRKQWKYIDRVIFQSIRNIDFIMKNFSIKWGLIGSVAYELVTNKNVVHEKSDIDLIIRYNRNLTVDVALQIVKLLNNLEFCIDIQVERGLEAFSLKEFAYSGGEPILIKTKFGPKIGRIV